MNNKKDSAVSATYQSLYTAVEKRAQAAKIKTFLSTQITFTGNIECRPMYVRYEDGNCEVAPYEYINASFYIDADAQALADAFNGERSITDLIAEDLIRVNGDAGLAILFFEAVISAAK